MQGDLISRKRVIETIWEVFNSYANDSQRFDEYETEAINNAFTVLQKEVENMNCAYDVENVVVELEEKSDDIPVQYENNYEQGYTDGIYYAIDIVRKWWKGVDNATN
jgi:hypothetical protein